MATKNYDKMSVKSLNVLLKGKNTTDEQRAQIQAVLDMRAEAEANKPKVVEVAPEAEGENVLTPEEEAAEKAKMEARRAIVEEMKAKIGKKANVVPFNTATWVEGTVTSVLDDARARNPLWVVKTPEGKTVRKAYGSELIEVTDEDGVIPVRKIGGKRGKKTYSQEQILQMLAEATGKIGYTIQYVNRDEVPVTGIIWSVMHEKRSNRVMLRVKLADGSFAHKVWGTEYTITEDYDEEVVKANAEKLARAEAFAKDPKAIVKFAQDELEALEKQLAGLQARIDAKKKEIEELEKPAEDNDEVAPADDLE